MTTIYHDEQIVAVKILWKCKTGNKVWFTANRALFESLPTNQQISRYAYILQATPVASPVRGDFKQDRVSDPTDYVCQDEPTGRMYLNGPASKRVARIWNASALSNPLIRDSGVVPIILDEGAVGSATGGRRTGTSKRILGYGWLIDSPDRLNEVQYDLAGPQTTHHIKIATGAGGCITSWVVEDGVESWDSELLNCLRKTYGRSIQVAPFGRNDLGLENTHHGHLNPNQHGSYYLDPDEMPWHSSPPPGPLLNDRVTHGAPMRMITPPTAQPEGGWIFETESSGCEWFVDQYPPGVSPPTETAGGFDRPVMWLGVRNRLQVWVNYKGRENCHRVRCSVEIDRPLVCPYHSTLLGVLQTGTWIGQFPYYGLRFGQAHNTQFFTYDARLGLRTDFTAVAAVPVNSGIEMRFSPQGVYHTGVLVAPCVTPSGSELYYVMSTYDGSNGLCTGVAFKRDGHLTRKGINEMQFLASRRLSEGDNPTREEFSTIAWAPLQHGYSRYGVLETSLMYPWAPTIQPPLWGPIETWFLTDTQDRVEASAQWLVAQGLL